MGVTVGAGRGSKLARRAATTGAVLAVATALVGLMHTPAGLRLYGRFVGGGCPVGRASAADVERGRLEVAHAARGREVAAARPALGFRLDASTADEVDTWASRHGLACRDRREGSLKVCSNVPAAALGRSGPVIDEVALAFSPTTHALVNLSAVRYRLTPEEAARHTHGLLDGLRAALGEPARVAGSLDPATLSATAYATSATFYEFRDYIADVTATNIPGEGVLVREHYMSAR
jgi:hypothetical protein